MCTIMIEGKNKEELFWLADKTGHGDKAQDTPAGNAIRFPFMFMPAFRKAVYENGYRFLTPNYIVKA